MDFFKNGHMVSNHQTPKLPKPKAIWSYELHKTFVDLCHNQLRNKQGSFFPKIVWNKIITDFNEQHGKDYDKKQMKNHWDNTKADWKMWYKLKNFEFGLGWDDEKNTIIATEEWWKNYIQACPDAYKFRFRGIDHAKKLTDLFLKGMATGKSQGSFPNDNAEPCENEENYGHEKIVDCDLDSQVPSEEPGVADLNDDSTDFQNSKRKRRGKKHADIVSSLESRKRTSSAVTLNKHMDCTCRVLETVVNTPRVEYKSTPKTEVTIKECIELLNQLEEVTKGSQLYLFACRLFLIKEHREMFEALEGDIRVSWLEYIKRKPSKDI